MREAPWECVHFALLSFKYIIGAVGMNSEDTSGPGPQVVREFLPFITRCLSSPNEDVLSAACACLLIVSDQMLSEEFTEETLAVVQHGITAVTKVYL